MASFVLAIGARRKFSLDAFEISWNSDENLRHVSVAALHAMRCVNRFRIMPELAIQACSLEFDAIINEKAGIGSDLLQERKGPRISRMYGALIACA